MNDLKKLPKYDKGKQGNLKVLLAFAMGFMMFVVMAAVAPDSFVRIKVKDAVLCDAYYKVDGSFAFYAADAALVSTATSANTANTIIKRGASGEFSAGAITASLVGNVTGNVSGSSGSCTGNAATATAATNATNVGVTDDTATNATMYPAWFTAVTGNLPAKTSSSKLTFNPFTGLLSATGFSGPLTGNVTGNASGSSGSCTGNSATATKSTNLVGGNSTTQLGSIPYQSDADTTTLLGPNTAATQKFLAMTGNGTNGAAPGWVALSALPEGVQGDIVYHNGTAWVVLNAGDAGKYLKTAGAGANPLWDSPAGAGTVTDCSVVTANGISGTVATSTSTPAITLSLGVITPTSVNGLTLASQAVGFTIAGGTTSKTLTVPLDASVSGTNTGDDKIYTTTGPATLTVGAITDGQYLKRDGNTIISATPAGAGDVLGPASHAASLFVQWNSTPDSKTLVAGVAGGNANGNIVLRTAAETLASDHIDEITAGHGVVIDSVTLKDGNINGRTMAPKRHIWIDAGAMIARTTTGAATATVESSTNKEMSDYFDFDKDADEFVCFRMALPDAWDQGTIKAKFFWTAASSTGTVKWYIQGIALSNDDAIDTAYGTAVGIEDTLITAGDVHVTAATGAVTVGGTPAVADVLYFQIYRDISEDDLAADARLIGVAIEYGESATEATAW